MLFWLLVVVWADWFSVVVALCLCFAFARLLLFVVLILLIGVILLIGGFDLLGWLFGDVGVTYCSGIWVDLLVCCF